METDRFSRHVKKPGQDPNKPFLVPDANFSRNVSFHVIRNADGDDMWIGRYMSDLIEVLAECHPEGVLVEIDGFTYLLTVAPGQKDLFNG